MKTDLKQLWNTVKFGMVWGNDSDDEYFTETVQHTVAHILACFITNETEKSCNTETCLHLTQCETFEEFEKEIKDMISPKIAWEDYPQFCPYCGCKDHITFVNGYSLKEKDDTISFYMDVDEWQCMSDKCDGHSFFV